jgi:hypothetical protein
MSKASIGTEAKNEGIQAPAAGVASHVKEAVSGTLRQSAEVVSATSERLADQGTKLRGYGDQAAKSLRDSADSIDEYDVARVKEDLSTAARSHIGVSLIAAGAAGLAIGLLVGRSRR